MPIDNFLIELKAQYEREFEVQRNLDDKAKSTISISGTLAGFLLAFATFILSGFSRNFEFFGLVSAFLIGGIAVTIISILLCAIGSQLKKYYYVMGGGDLYSEKKDERDKEIARYKGLTEDLFNEEMIKDYSDATTFNAEVNENKARLVFAAQWLFFGGVIAIVGLVFFVVYAVGIGEFSFGVEEIIPPDISPSVTNPSNQ